MTEGARASAAVAWVESPFQLLGAVEAFAAGHLGSRLVVLPRLGVEPLVHTIAELRRLGLPAGLEVRAPAAPPRRAAGTFAVGDGFSGEVQHILVRSLPQRLVLLDDGRSTRRVLEALSTPGIPLVRPHVTPSTGRSLLARAALSRLRRQAKEGRLTLVTALDLPDTVTEPARRAGVDIRRHSFGWLREFPVPAAPGPDTVVLGTSLVANDLIAADPYVTWVQAIAAQGPLTYWSHRREDLRTLGPLGRTPGVTVSTGRLPAEIRLRGLTTHRLFTLPTTAVTTLRLLAPHTRIHEYAVPPDWWLDGVPAAARQHLVPDTPDGPPRLDDALAPAVTGKAG